MRYDEKFITSRDGDLYNLTLTKLSFTDIGSNFTCKAENEVGFSRAFIEVTGISTSSSLKAFLVPLNEYFVTLF